MKERSSLETVELLESLTWAERYVLIGVLHFRLEAGVEPFLVSRAQMLARVHVGPSLLEAAQRRLAEVGAVESVESAVYWQTTAYRLLVPELARVYGGVRPGRAPRDRLRRGRIYARDGGRCRLCGSPERLSIDHIIPRVRGGTHADENLRTLCFGCNEEKGVLL